MRVIIKKLALPIAAIAACFSTSDAAIAQSATAKPEIEKVDLCHNVSCATARLKGIDTTFHVGYTAQCEGLRYPEQPWPDNCTIHFFNGPEINRIFFSGPEIESADRQNSMVRFTGPKTFALVNRFGLPIKMKVTETGSAIKVTSASISPNYCMSRENKCVATFEGYGNRIFSKNPPDTFSVSWECRGLEYPAMPWPKGCVFMPTPTEIMSEIHKKYEECTPECVIRYQPGYAPYDSPHR